MTEMGSGYRCAGGACACPAENTCGDACVDTQADAMNCGTCGNVCPAGIACEAGTCACPSGGTVCGGACVDTQTDTANCGTCDHACTVAGATCEEGACACPGGGTECGGTCVDTQTDTANCGVCGMICAAPTTACEGGECVCPGGESVCSGSCVDTTTDPKNCGACGHDCLGGGCQGGLCQPVVLASGQVSPSDLAINATDIYWTTHGSSQQVMRMPIGGGTPVAVATGTSQQTELYLALNTSGIYWTFRTGTAVGGYTSTIMRAPLGGGAATTLATVQGPTFGKGLLGLAADANYVYWADADAQSITRTPSAGGTLTTVDSSFVFTTGWAFKIASGRFWFISAGTLFNAVVTNGVFNPVAGSNVNDYAVDTSNVYWSSATSGVEKAPITGGASETLYPQAAYGAVVDTQYVFFTDGSKLSKVPTGGGSAVPITNSISSPKAVDSNHVYWVDQTAGTINRVAK